jgi:hypothetical protein
MKNLSNLYCTLDTERSLKTKITKEETKEMTKRTRLKTDYTFIESERLLFTK